MTGNVLNSVYGRIPRGLRVVTAGGIGAGVIPRLGEGTFQNFSNDYSEAGQIRTFHRFAFTRTWKLGDMLHAGVEYGYMITD